ncbi:MAG: metallophosphoesterase family protein [Deltaproteobacteria bacterium]|uniref:Metallophosphoesterase family protein n=1 Tax=Candidatus Zymogenus saltonus TaxID=2844893 RepID=A0A9D8PPK2_9DELT|nr:metallophosphoesterase family protein [Candidatus Zymogenus saltonus]
MNYAVLSDVHGNIEALTAVLEDVERSSVMKIVFLGDVVGYGADPAECLRLIEGASDISVVGNHDLAIADGSGLDDLNEDAALAARWTATLVSDYDRKKMMKLPLEHVEADSGIHFVHGSPDRPERFNYILSKWDAEKGFAGCGSRVVFVGHSHIPAAFVELEYRRTFTGEVRRVKELDASKIQLETGYRYIINVGSVGQPRDGDPRATYGIYDSGNQTFYLKRVPYDVEKAASKIREAGLPEALAQRLRSGR